MVFVVLFRVDYCNSLLAGLPVIALAPLQRVLNAVTRYVADLRPRDHVTLVQRLCIGCRSISVYNTNLCILMYGAAHGCTRLHHQSGYTDIRYVGPLTSSLCRQPQLRHPSDADEDGRSCTLCRWSARLKRTSC